METAGLVRLEVPGGNEAGGLVDVTEPRVVCIGLVGLGKESERLVYWDVVPYGVVTKHEQMHHEGMSIYTDQRFLYRWLSIWLQHCRRTGSLQTHREYSTTQNTALLGKWRVLS